VYILKTFNPSDPWLNDTELALRVRDLGFDSQMLHFFIFYLFIFIFFFYYFSRNAKRLSRRAGLSAIADFLARYPRDA